MSTSLNARFNFSVISKQVIDPYGAGVLTDIARMDVSKYINSVGSVPADVLACSKHYHSSGVVALDASTVFDLTDLINYDGEALSFSRVNLVVVQNVDTLSQFSISMCTFTPYVNANIPLDPNGGANILYNPKAAGYAVTSGMTIRLNTVALDVTPAYKLLVIGD